HTSIIAVGGRGVKISRWRMMAMAAKNGLGIENSDVMVRGRTRSIRDSFAHRLAPTMFLSCRRPTVHVPNRFALFADAQAGAFEINICLQQFQQFVIAPLQGRPVGELFKATLLSDRWVKPKPAFQTRSVPIPNQVAPPKLRTLAFYGSEQRRPLAVIL